MNLEKKRLWNGIAAAALLAASAASAREYYNYNGTNNWVSVHYINFYTSSPEGTDRYLSYPFGGSSDNLKYFDYSLTIPSGTACFEVETMPYSDPNNFNTRIWTYNGGFRSVDDDSGPGAGSKMRAYLSGNAAVVLWIAAKVQQYNTMRFEAKISQLNLGEASCTTNQSLPWVKKINSTTTLSANAN